jgi:hypothetical protein
MEILLDVASEVLYREVSLALVDLGGFIQRLPSHSRHLAWCIDTEILHEREKPGMGLSLSIWWWAMNATVPNPTLIPTKLPFILSASHHNA